MIYLELIWVFVNVGLLSIGGGHSAIPIIEQLAVNQYGWFSSSQFANLITISEMTPGPITINAATFVGMQVGGVFGAIVATLAVVIPAFVVLALIVLLLKKLSKIQAVQEVLKQLRPVMLGLMLTSVVGLFIYSVWGDTNTFSILALVSIVVLVALQQITFKIKNKPFKLGPMYIILISGIIGLITYFV